ncbi:hypothetical protein M9H77_17458 [Catharanthus roseus]|uniref:Uncharacterized protein n=1 Tax=Catharanthus roseus TaxID=4058 RepID=A0ACC0B4N4_CATRO|nr:hypothetical protein M9H77_17458 [Catharanthus roseus]
MKKNRMQGRNTVKEVLCLNAQRGYTVFYRNCEDSNVLRDIIVAYPTSIEMIRMWPCILIMDTMYKTNKTLEIGGDIPHSQAQDMEMRDLASLLDQISTGPILKVREMHRLVKRIRFRSGLGSRGRGRPPQAPRGRSRGCSSVRSSLSSIIDPSTPSTFPFIDAFLGFVYPFIENLKNVISDGNCGYRVVGDFMFGMKIIGLKSIDECLLSWSI